jgi:ferredoxin
MMGLKTGWAFAFLCLWMVSVVSATSSELGRVQVPPKCGFAHISTRATASVKMLPTLQMRTPGLDGIGLETSQASSLLHRVTSLALWSASGALLAAAATYAFTKSSRAQDGAQDRWALAAIRPDREYPGPGRHEDEYEVTVVWKGEERKLIVRGDESILMACEEAGLSAPYLCRNGVCLECTGKVVEGMEHIRRDSQCHNDENVDAGYVCTCSTYVGGSGLKIEMEKMEEAYKKQFGKFEEEEKLREAKKKGAFFR